MADTLTYNAKAGTLSARIGGRLTVVPALPAAGGRIVGWDKVQELRTGRKNSDGKYVLTSVQHAGAPDGDPNSPIILGQLPNTSHGRGSSHAGGINILLADGSVRGVVGALHLHAWPPRAQVALVVVRGWDPMRKALAPAQEVRLVVVP